MIDRLLSNDRYKPNYTKTNEKFFDLTILKIDFYDKILVLARAI